MEATQSLHEIVNQLPRAVECQLPDPFCALRPVAQLVRALPSHGRVENPIFNNF
jgi:hypothetical protein